MYIPEIRNKGYSEYPSLYVGKAKVGDFFENEDWQDMIDRMYAKMIREFFEAEGVNFYEDENEDD
jgi:hypothetical protein